MLVLRTVSPPRISSLFCFRIFTNIKGLSFLPSWFCLSNWGELAQWRIFCASPCPVGAYQRTGKGGSSPNSANLKPLSCSIPYLEGIIGYFRAWNSTSRLILAPILSRTHLSTISLSDYNTSSLSHLFESGSVGLIPQRMKRPLRKTWTHTDCYLPWGYPRKLPRSPPQPCSCGGEGPPKWEV